MVNIRPDQTFQEVIQRGVTVFRGLIQGVSEVLRTGDSAIKDLDDAMRGGPTAVESADQTFLAILAMLRGAMEEARETGTATGPGVVQRARETLNKVTIAEPSWRPAPAIIRTTTDMCRMALRDLRGSEALVKLATGRGDVNDLETLINWGDDVGKRVGEAQQVVAEPKPTAEPEAKAKPTAKPKPTRAKRPAGSKMTEKQAQDTVFRAIAESSGDQEFQREAEEVAAGRMKPDDFAEHVSNGLGKGKLNASMMKKAKEKAIQDGVSPTHPLLGF